MIGQLSAFKIGVVEKARNSCLFNMKSIHNIRISGLGEEDRVSDQIIGSAIRVHRALGPGLLESAYQECLVYELTEAGLKVEREKNLPLKYRKIVLDHGYRLDLLIEGCVVVELKVVDSLTDVHFAQVLTYLKIGAYKLGLLINFNVKLLKNGIQRIINS